MSVEDKLLPGHLAIMRMIEITVRNSTKTPKPSKQDLAKTPAVLNALFQTLLMCNIPKDDLKIVIGRSRNAISNMRPEVDTKRLFKITKELEARSSIRHRTKEIIRGTISRITGR